MLILRGTTAFVLLSISAGCGGSVVFEEDGGDGGQGGGTPSTSSSASAQGGSTSTGSPTSTGQGTPTSSGSQTTTTAGVTTGPTVSVGVTTGGQGCGTLLQDLGTLGLGQSCDTCTEDLCCNELLRCSAGTECYGCIFGPECTGQGSSDLDALSQCIFGPCAATCSEQPQCNPEEFTCFDGSCIPFEWVCDGRFDCGDGSDEGPQICGGCGPGDFACNDGACIPGEWVCDQFADCSNAEDENPDLCGGCGPNDFTCNDGACIPGEWVCDQIVDCANGEDELCNGGICDSGLASGDPNIDACLGDTCCFEFEQCTSFGQQVDACFVCLQNGGGPLCDDALTCAFASGCVDGPPPPPPVNDICGTGWSSGDGQTDACLSDACCDGWFACLDAGDNACLECLNGGGGPICDAFAACSCGNCGLCF